MSWIADLPIAGNRQCGIGLLRRWLGLVSGPRNPFGRATHIDAGAIAARDFRIHPAQHHSAAVERYDLAVLRPAGVSGWTDIVFAVGRSFELQLLQLRAVGEIHHHAVIGPARDIERLAALTARCRRRARQVAVIVEGAIAPAADDFFRAVLR